MSNEYILNFEVNVHPMYRDIVTTLRSGYSWRDAMATFSWVPEFRIWRDMSSNTEVCRAFPGAVPPGSSLAFLHCFDESTNLWKSCSRVMILAVWEFFISRVLPRMSSKIITCWTLYQADWQYTPKDWKQHIVHHNPRLLPLLTAPGGKREKWYVG